MRFAFVVFALLLPAFDASAQAPHVVDQVGDAYEIVLDRVTETSGDRSSSRSHDRWTLVERVVALRDGGAELAFDLPADTSEHERAISWQFPVRVFRSADGALSLLNAPEAELRLRAWLSEQERALCGHWVFSWTAQKIECDPQSAITMIEPYLPPGDLQDGVLYREAAALAPVPLHAEARASDPTFVATLEIDPEAVRHQRAETDVATAEMMQRPPLALDSALQARVAEQISGTIVTTIETDADGRATRRARVIQIDIVGRDGSHERQRTTETTQWRLTSR